MKDLKKKGEDFVDQAKKEAQKLGEQVKNKLENDETVKQLNALRKVAGISDNMIKEGVEKLKKQAENSVKDMVKKAKKLPGDI